MITLSDTKFGTKRKAIIESVKFNVSMGNMDLTFFVQLLDANGNLLNDKSLAQNRVVYYSVSNQNKVNAQFNIVQSGGKGEYDYFFELMETNLLKSLILQLAAKLNERGIFD
jgi:hypothetical protein